MCSKPMKRLTSGLPQRSLKSHIVLYFPYVADDIERTRLVTQVKIPSTHHFHKETLYNSYKEMILAFHPISMYYTFQCNMF